MKPKEPRDSWRADPEIEILHLQPMLQSEAPRSGVFTRAERWTLAVCVAGLFGAIKRDDDKNAARLH